VGATSNWTNDFLHDRTAYSSENGNGRIQTFSFTAPTAISVQLVGDFTHWRQKPVNLQKGPEGIWHTTVELQPGPHRCRFLVDSQ
jgi:1,4-alpha-glucan branching enzyme